MENFIHSNKALNVFEGHRKAWNQVDKAFKLINPVSNRANYIANIVLPNDKILGCFHTNEFWKLKNISKMSSDTVRKAKGRTTKERTEEEQGSFKSKNDSKVEPKIMADKTCNFGGCYNPACPSDIRKCWHKSPAECSFFRHFTKAKEDPKFDGGMSGHSKIRLTQNQKSDEYQLPKLQRHQEYKIQDFGLSKCFTRDLV